MKTTTMVANELRVPYWQIKFAHASGAVPRPQQIAGRYFYSPDDISKLKSHFSKGKRKYVRRKVKVAQPVEGQGL